MRIVPWVLLWGCQPRVFPEPELCNDQPPAPGEVYVGPVDCTDMRIPGGEGRNADYWMANHAFRAILRHPQDAQTVLRVGGGTVVDAAPWGSDDQLHEAIPIVSGGWLALESFEVGDDEIRMGGTVVALPDQPADDPGAWREVTWRIEPDSPWLHLEGADGLWIHGEGGASLLDGQWVYDALVYGHDGEVAEDLGGAIRVTEPTGLLVAPRSEAWSHLGGAPLSGVAPGATDIEVFRDGQRVARLPVDEEGVFDGDAPPGSDVCRAIAPGSAPSPTAAVGTDLTLDLGGTGSLVLTQHPPQPVAVSWSDADGRTGWRLLSAEGGQLDFGAGVYDLNISAGPTWRARDLRVEIPGGTTVALGVQLDALYDPGNRVLAATTWPSDRSRTWRGSNTASAQRAAGEGIGYLVFTPEDDISSADSNALGFPAIPVRNGSLTTGDGWSLATWTWSSNSKRSAHGAIDPSGLDAAQGLAAASGGPVVDRLGVVDLPALGQMGAPHLVNPHPDLVRLDHPGATGPTDSPWQPWFDWLDAGGLLAPVGPRTWVDVVDRNLYGAVDVEAGLIRGETVATTGSLVTLDIGGFGPGHVVSEDDRQPGWEVHIAVLGDAPLDQLALVGAGGSILRSWTDETEVDDFLLMEDEHWVLAMAWSTQTDDFAVTGPVWVRPPP
jgi:hypothetical protein